jgi:hypothetical protein
MDAKLCVRPIGAKGACKWVNAHAGEWTHPIPGIHMRAKGARIRSPPVVRLATPLAGRSGLRCRFGRPSHSGIEAQRLSVTVVQRGGGGVGVVPAFGVAGFTTFC